MLSVILEVTDVNGNLLPIDTKDGQALLHTNTSDLVLITRSKFGEVRTPLPGKIAEWMQKTMRTLEDQREGFQNPPMPLIAEPAEKRVSIEKKVAAEKITQPIPLYAAIPTSGWTNIAKLHARRVRASAMAAVETSAKAKAESEAKMITDAGQKEKEKEKGKESSQEKRTRILHACAEQMGCSKPKCGKVHGIWEPTQEAYYQENIRKGKRKNAQGMATCVYALKGMCEHFKTAVCTYRHFTSIVELSKEQEAEVQRGLEGAERLRKCHLRPKVEVVKAKVIQTDSQAAQVKKKAVSFAPNTKEAPTISQPPKRFVRRPLTLDKNICAVHPVLIKTHKNAQNDAEIPKEVEVPQEAEVPKEGGEMWERFMRPPYTQNTVEDTQESKQLRVKAQLEIAAKLQHTALHAVIKVILTRSGSIRLQDLRQALIPFGIDDWARDYAPTFGTVAEFVRRFPTVFEVDEFKFTVTLSAKAFEVAKGIPFGADAPA
jgi:hypothetical protein